MEVSLRAVEQGDVAQWRSWINLPEVMHGLDRALPATEEDHRRFIERHVAGNPNAIWFSIDANDGTYVGNIWLWDINWRHKRAEVRLFVGNAEYRGRGLATAAIRSISDYAFATQGLHKLYAFVHADNQQSRRAFESAGFAVEAVLREEAFRDGKFADVWRLIRLAP